MPVYNGERYLSDAIGSIRKFTRSIPYEILLCDDASTDHSITVIKRMAAGHNNVNVLLLKDNVGAGEARNLLAKRAQSDIFMILDCDNILVGGQIEKMLAMIDSGSDVVSTEKIKFFGYYHPKKPDSEWDFKQWGGVVDLGKMLKSFEVPPCSGNYMYRRKVFDTVGGYHTDDIQETWGFGFRHVVAGFPVYTCPDTYYLHRFCRDGFFMRLPKNKIAIATYNNLLKIKDLLSHESQKILDDHLEDKNGSKIISEGNLRLK